MSIQFNRRDVVRGMVNGAVGLALTPTVFSQIGAPAGKIALRYNENPYGPSAKAIQAAYEAVNESAYYAPIPLQNSLLTMIANKNKLSRENLVLSSGSVEALGAAFVAWGKKGQVLIPGLTFSDHFNYSRKMGIKMKSVPLKKDLSIDLERMEAAVDDNVSLIYICNPNNPTGLTLDGDELRDFCRSVGGKATVLVDEAYNELTDSPTYTAMTDLVRDGENVIVIRTFSKIFGMAGMRIGYGMARPDHAKTITGHLVNYPNVPGLAAAKAIYDDQEFIAFSRNKVLKGRNMVIDTLRRNGLEPLTSQTNFVYVDLGRDASEFQRLMAERNILIRGAYEGYPTYSRISMGRIEEIEIFQRVFTEVFNS